MKTKFFLLLAAMLLGSASAFAQSSNIEPARGDVNGDGTVDVADIVAVMQIMKEAGGAVGEKMAYWYAGTDEVTPDNFTNVSSRIAESKIPETGSLTAGGKFVYFVMPNTRYLSSLVDDAGTPVEFECSDIMGYNIYRTKNEAFGSLSYTIKETVYYWYAGQTKPTNISSNPTVDDTNFTVNKWHTLGDATTIAKTVTGGTSGTTWYVAVPTSVGLKPTASDNITPDTSWDNEGTITINGVSYTVWNTNKTGTRCAVYMAKI